MMFPFLSQCAKNEVIAKSLNGFQWLSLLLTFGCYNIAPRRLVVHEFLHESSVTQKNKFGICWIQRFRQRHHCINIDVGN